MPEDKNIVLPGDKLCVIEEFMPNEGSYESVDGNVRASVIGRVQFNASSKIVKVQGFKKLSMPLSGSFIIGVVTATKEDLAFVDILLDNDGKAFPGRFTGVIHVSQAHTKFIKNIEEAIKPNDVIRAKVLTSITPYQLTLRAPNLGVIMAFCSICGNALVKKDAETLVCPICGNVEKRKIAINYVKQR